MPGDVTLIIGGTRATGLHAARLLQQRGNGVRILARDPAAASKRLGPGFDIVPGDVTKPDTLTAAFSGIANLIFTAGVRSGRFARESVVKATEYEGVLNTIAAARAQNFRGRFVYMTSIGVRRRSLLAFMVNTWKGNTLRWRRHAEDAIRASGLDYCIVRAAFLLNRPGGRRAIAVSQDESPLRIGEAIAREDAAEALVEAMSHPRASRATFEVKWSTGPRTSLATLFDGLRARPS